MNSQRFHDARLKLERGEHHIGELEGEIAAWREKQPYQFIEERESTSGQYLIRVAVTHPPPVTELSLIASDAIHNLRSCLDYVISILVDERVASSVVPKPNRQEMNRVGFPVNDLSKDLPSNITAKVQLAGQQTMEQVSAVEPFRDGRGHRIWQLHTLNNIDKHRLMLTVGTTLTSVNVIQYGLPKAGMDLLRAGGVPPVFLDAISRIGLGVEFSGEDTAFIRLDDGVVVWANQRSPSEMNMHFDRTIDITFEEPDILKREPIGTTLRNFANDVSELVAVFERLPNPVP